MNVWSQNILKIATKTLLFFTLVAPTLAAPIHSIYYQNSTITLAKSYQSFEEYQDDPHHLPKKSIKQAATLIKQAKFGPNFVSTTMVGKALSQLQFPGYGSFYANQLGAKIDSELELVYLEIPGGTHNRYIALSKQANGTLRVIDDFLGPQLPEITRVHRNRSGALQYSKTNGQIIATRSGDK